MSNSHCKAHASSISLGTCPTQKTPRTTPQEGQNAIATPTPFLGALKEICWTSNLHDGHLGLIAFIDSDFILSFEYRRYHERMKSTPDSETTPSEKMRAFKDGLRQVLSVSKTELSEREKQYQAERATHPKRGPKPKPSASGHVSGDGD